MLRRARRRRGRSPASSTTRSRTSRPVPASTATSPRRSARGRASSSRTTAAASTRSATRSSATTASSWMYPVLLTSLIEAADRVDSTTGVQMAYVKQWAPRSYQDRRAARAGAGRAVRARPCSGDACELAGALGPFDLAYLDPPYNQHRYFTNYHIWETLVAWDAPEHYGVACKRVDARDPIDEERVQRPARACPTRSRRSSPTSTPTLVVVSYNDESWVPIDAARGDVPARAAARSRTLAFDSQALRRRADRHPQPAGREGREGVAPAQRRVRRVSRASRELGRTSNRSSGMQIEGNVAARNRRGVGVGRGDRPAPARGRRRDRPRRHDRRARSSGRRRARRPRRVRALRRHVAGRCRRRGRARRRRAAGSRSRCTARAAGSRRARSRATALRTTSTRSGASIELNLVGTFNVLRLAAAGMAKQRARRPAASAASACRPRRSPATRARSARSRTARPRPASSA